MRHRLQNMGFPLKLRHAEGELRKWIWGIFLLACLLPQGCSKTHGTKSGRLPAPTPTPLPQRTERDFTRDQLPWLRRHTVEAAEKGVRKDTTLDPLIDDFLKGACLYELHQAGAPELGALASAGHKLLDAGYDHPIFLRALGRVLDDARETTAAIAVDRQALGALQGQPYSKVNTFLAARQLEIALRKLPDRAQQDMSAARRTALEALTASLAAGEFQPDESPIAYRLLSGFSPATDTENPWKSALAALQGKPVDPWLLRMLQGAAALEDAWARLGGPLAPQATPDALKAFRQELAQARPPLVEAWRLHPDRPEAATAMITVAMGEEHHPAGETIRTWFGRAVLAQNDAMAAYEALALALNPRWGGSYEAMERFGEECLATRRYDTSVPLFYWAILYDLAAEQPGGSGSSVFRRPGVHENLKSLFENMLRSPAWAAERMKIQILQATVEGWCGNPDASARLMASLGTRAEWRGQLLGRPITGNPAGRSAALPREAAAPAPGMPQAPLGGSVQATLRPTVGVPAAPAAPATSASLPLVPLGTGPAKPLAPPSGQSLMEAINQKNPALAEELIRQGADVKYAGPDGMTPLHLAARQRLTGTMRLLLAGGASVNALNAAGETPLHLACKNGAIESVRILLDGGAKVNQPSPEGWTPLELAVERQYVNIVKLLLERGANVKTVDRNGLSPLNVAVRAGSAEIVRQLLDLGAAVNAGSGQAGLPLHEAISLGHQEIAIQLIDLGAKVNAPDGRGNTPLHMAVERGQTAVVTKLLATGALPDTRTPQGVTALQLAIEKDLPEIVQLLVAKGSGVRAPASDGGTLLQVAQRRGDPRVIQMIQNQMLIKRMPVPGVTPLVGAAPGAPGAPGAATPAMPTVPLAAPAATPAPAIHSAPAAKPAAAAATPPPAPRSVIVTVVPAAKRGAAASSATASPAVPIARRATFPAAPTSPNAALRSAPNPLAATAARTSSGSLSTVTPWPTHASARSARRPTTSTAARRVRRAAMPAVPLTAPPAPLLAPFPTPQASPIPAQSATPAPKPTAMPAVPAVPVVPQ